MTPPLRLAFVIPDHPWVDAANGAAVRISMSVADRIPASELPGCVQSVEAEKPSAFGEIDVQLAARTGVIHPDLRVGANLGAAHTLRANTGVSSMGYILGGRGFVLDPAQANELSRSSVGAREHIYPLWNGQDIVGVRKSHFVIDAYGLTEHDLRFSAPALWQHLLHRVKPERDLNPDPRVRERWWLFRRSNEQLRGATTGLARFLVTPETAKHRPFTFVDASARPEHRLVVVAIGDALVLGVLSSAIHVAWALAAGGTLEDRPVYNKTRCFEPFPFPSDDTGLTPELTARIRALAERLDAHRKTQQAAHPDLTLTGIYNVLEKLRHGEPLTAKDKLIHELGLVSVLKSLHDELDAAVLAAYGWSDLGAALADHGHAEARVAAVDELLQRLVALNARRAAEEAAGHVRWLRPEFQTRGRHTQTVMDVSTAPAAEEAEEDSAEPAAAAAAALPKRPWPTGLPEQIKAVAEVLASAGRPFTPADLEARFSARGRWRDRLPVILETLEALGRARRAPGVLPRWQGS